jgi:hypothetical protein
MGILSRPKIPEMSGLPGQPSEEPQKSLPWYTVKKKDKVFYVCEACHGLYPCNLKNRGALVEFWKDALKEAKNDFKSKHKTLTLTSKGLTIHRVVNVTVKLRESTCDRILPAGMVDEIRQDALNDLLLCPSCQRWVCKINCWNIIKGLCVTCVSQGAEAKQVGREELQVTKAKNFCPYCGAKITDPAQIRCSKCDALLLL